MTQVEGIRPLSAVLREHALDRPDKVAFADEERQVTYGGLETRTGRLAGHLAGHGLGRGDRVAILLGNSVTTVESYLGVTRAAAVGVPVNPQSSDAELAHQLDDSGARFVITDGAHLEQVTRLRPGRTHLTIVLAHGEDPDTLAFDALAGTEPAQAPRDDLGLDEPAWILYTSGTTGRAKGVVSTQRGCLWSVRSSYQGVLGLAAEDRLLWPLPLFHSLAHILCVLGVTLTGATARILPGFGARDVLEALRSEPYTMLLGVPSMYFRLLEAVEESGRPVTGPRVCLVTGAATGAALAEAVERVLGAPLVNSYGSTETCGAITMSRPDEVRVPGTVGTVVPGARLRLVDPRTGRDVPPGEEGEVLVDSPGLMAGYHGRPEETAAALRDGWYRTGDLARRDDEGRLAVTGRVKELIIRAGENIQPGEIEAVLRTVPGVRDVAVTGRPDEALGEVPVAYIVAEPEGWSPAAALAACRDRLSYFKVPVALYETTALPLTGSGKVSRGRLGRLPARLRGVGTTHHDHLWETDWVPWEDGADTSGTRPTAHPDGQPSDIRPGPGGEPGRWAVIGGREPAFEEAVRRAGGQTEHCADPAAARAAGPFDGYLLAGPAPAKDAHEGPGAPEDRDGSEDPDGLPGFAALAAAGPPRRTIVLTRGAVAVRPGEPVDPSGAARRAWFRAHASGRPGRTLLVDLEPPAPEGESGALPAAAWDTLLTGLGEETECAVRAGTVHLPRLSRTRATTTAVEPPGPAGDQPEAARPGVTDGDAEAEAGGVRTGPAGAQAGPAGAETEGGAGPEGTVLVTGAGTPLARVLAGHLVAGHGVRSIALAGTGPTASRELARELAGMGAEVTVHTARADTEAGAAALLTAAAAGAPLAAIVHPLTGPDATRAAAHLMALTGRGSPAPTPLTLCGPLGEGLAHAGSPAQAAAEARLAALAHDAPHTTLIGLVPGPATPVESATATPVVPGALALTDRETADAFDIGRTLPGPVLALRVDPWRLRSDPAATRLRTLLRPPASGGTGTPAAGTAEAEALRSGLGRLPGRARSRALVDLVREEAARTLGLAGPSLVDTTLAFVHLGLTSLTAVALRDRLAARTGLRLPVTLAFDHPTPAAVAEVLARDLFGRADAPATAATCAAPAADDPVVLVGTACRYPGGVASPEDLWRLVADGRDAIGPFPTDRGWDLDRLLSGDGTEPGTSATGSGGFLDAPGDFDAGFFGISPREALAMDPQQRLLLEVGWEAIERAGIDPHTLRHTDTGVYVGLMFHDYAKNPGALPEDLERLLGTGTAGSVASGRLAYTLGLSGPALTVDTACSSSLVALHLAAQALRRGECSLALAAGVAVMATPGTFVEFSRQHGLAADGRCKAFSSDADGTGWSEGVGVVVLERLSDARRHGHPVLAVLRGGAVNQDGASNGLTAPSGPAQQQVIRRALADAGLSPADVDAVEAHGTGTVLGDPIEANALLATYGRERDPARPLLLGSLKSNIGHAQSAAGVGAVIKMVEAIRRGELPRTLHADRPTTAVDWDAGAVRLLREHTPWPRSGSPRRAAVSSFGVSGTNAHLILEQAPDPVPLPASSLQAPDPAPGATPSRAAAPEPRAEPPEVPFVLSARTPAALRTRAAHLLARLREDPDLPLPDLAAALATTRSDFPRRAAFVAAGRAELERRLTVVADSDAKAGAVPGGLAVEGGLALAFTGQGSQRPGMGRELYAAYPVFAEALDAARAALDPHLARPLRAVMWAAEDTPEAALLDRTDFTQPALFALETALFRLVESWGVVPDLVLGHSVGGLTAAHAAGVLSLPDAASLVAARGRLMAALPAGGAMAALEATEEEVRTALAGMPGTVEIAAVNGPRAVVVSGDADAVDTVGDGFRARERRVTPLRVSHAFHSRHMDPMLDDFRAVARTVTFRPPLIPVVSDVTGRVAESAQLCSPDYWVRHAREAVRFADAVRALPGTGTASLLELGPDAVLTAMARDCLADGEPFLCGGLRRGRPEARTLLDAVTRAHAHGVPVDWVAFFADRPARPVDLPVYPFEHRRYWLASLPAPRPDGTGTPALPAADRATTEAAGPGDGTRPGTDTPPGRRLRTELAALPDDRRAHTLLDVVRTEIAEVAGFEDPTDVDPRRSMKDLGLDSVSAVDLRNRLVARTAVDLPASLAFDHPTAAAMARHLLGELRPGLDGPQAGDDGAGGGPRTVFGELDRLENRLEAEPLDGTARDRIVARLRALTARLADGPADRPASTDGADLGELIGAATTDQLFDLIDNELKGP
ncbi:AMP-binding protein [Streptomyces sp. NBC_01216]|uniref:polyketide synthase n=1 Tax=Streptomyces sp. NBC_01216 TaxID=2903778 RepID=UPI002E130BDA|nr:polyketide synthase [Streptomyces sp. NBC_01216]WSQ64009.1 AMP-binding protein [Streptomyces sp. NBC_01216]